MRKEKEEGTESVPTHLRSKPQKALWTHLQDQETSFGSGLDEKFEDREWVSSELTKREKSSVGTHIKTTHRHVRTTRARTPISIIISRTSQNIARTR